MSLEAEYSVAKTLRETADGTRWVEALSAVGHPVSIKVLGAGSASADAGRLRHEYEVGSQLDCTCVLRPLSLGNWGGQPALVFETFEGQPLELQLGAPMRVDHFFSVADGITRALAEVHAGNVVHRDIKPQNILVGSVSGEVRLTGLGIASLLPAERASIEGTSLIEGTLAYMSPEQTGRMNRQVDQRSDLYSLGVTFYEMLTGRLPFEASDPLEWVHCHVARVPPAPSEVAPSTPRALSAIVMKLLSKLADERYQTALGLRRDLARCRELVVSGKGAEPFRLGERDAPDRLQLPQRLYGRKAESDALLAAFERVVHGGTSEVVLVSGSAGSGKSSLVRELGEPVVRERGLFASGKFDQLTRDIPHGTLVQAFEELVQETLASSDERLQAWRQRLLDALGKNGRVIADVIPQIELVIGPQPAVSALLPGEARNRFDATFRRFVGAFATAARPLVLFLDDLQWADAGSLRLLEEIVTDEQIQHVLFVGAYRESELPPSHPARGMYERIRKTPTVVTTIALAPLSLEPMRQLVEDTLRVDAERARPLAKLVHEKTGGNPFFAVQFLTSLHEDRLLLLDLPTHTWNWDLARIEEKAVTENVVDLLIKKLSALPAAALEVLKTAACIGNRVPADILARAHGRSEDETRQDAWEAMQESLILRAGDAYVFAHDRVQEAVYSLIPEEARAATHLRIGRLLLANMSPHAIEERLFDVVSQLNRGASLLTDAEERNALARLNALAGARARTTIAFAAARSYFATATKLLALDAWTTSYEKTFSLYLDRAECEYLVAEFKEADALFEVLLAHARTNSDRVRASILRVRLYQFAGKPDDGVTVMFEAVRPLGMTFPDTDEALRAALHAEQEKIAVNLRGRKISELVDAPVATDTDVRALISLLVVAMPCAHIARPRFFPLIVLRALNLALVHGNTEEACFAYIAYGTLLVSIFGDIPSAFEFSEMALRLNEKFADATLKGVLLYLHAHFIHSWRRPFKAVVPMLDKVHQACVEVGQLAFAGYHGFHCVWLAVERGESLDEAMRVSEKYMAFARETHNEMMRHTIQCEQQVVKCLSGSTRQPASFDDDTFSEAEFLEFARAADLSTVSTFFHITKEVACFTYGQYEQALDHSRLATPTLVTVLALPVEATHHFYRALTLAALHRHSPAEQKAELAQGLAHELKKLAHWAESCPENYQNRHALVAAEAARIEGRDLDAMRLYDEAIRSARDNGIVANEALAFELAAEFYRDRGQELIADTYLSQACARFARWGAHGKVRQLERKFPQLAERPRGSPVPTEGLRAEQLDVLTVMKASQAISGKIEIDELIDTLMRVVLESAAAQSASLLLVRDNAVQLAAVASMGPEGVSVQRQLGSAPTPSQLPASIINYVRRTRERVRLGNATRANPFAADEYLVSRQTKSVLCLPIVRRAELAGLLYLENNLVTDAFTPERLAVLELLAGQAAISLEIANLVETERHAREALKSSESRFRRIFESNMIGLHFGDLSGRIHEANQYLLDMLGYTREDVESGRLNWTEITPPQWEAASKAAVEQVRSFGRCLPFEKEYIRKDGTLVPALIGSSLFPGKKEEVLSFILDITERKRAESALHRSEENLRQVQKMEAIGNLAGGIAHDFNNLLSIILGYSSLLLTEMTAADPRHLYIDEISEAGTRAATLTKQLLAFGRKQMLQPKVVTLDAIVSGVERMLRRLIGEDIELTVLAQPGPGTVRVDPGQVEQIIMNLAVNSRDAMPQGGKLTLETANVELDASYAAEHQGVTAGPHVMLAVTDTGTGMDEATQARMFEPFFTTKEIGKGTGLGLSTVFGIVQQSGGSVRVDTALGKGTSIKIYFPRVDATAAELGESVRPQAAAGARAEIILLVEDDPHVRTLVRTILEQFGYEVLEAQNGGDALLICEDQSQPIHLLLTDVIMPRMSGAQLAERLQPIRPTMKVLFMSGYADDSIVHQGLLKPGVAFLQKPITPETLTRKVREVLDSENQGTG